jgi:hypothetical protein
MSRRLSQVLSSTVSAFSPSHSYLHPSYPHPQVDPLAVKWCAILYNNRAAAHLGTGQLKEAVSDCHQAIARDPLYARAFLRRARALAVSGLRRAIPYTIQHCLVCPVCCPQLYGAVFSLSFPSCSLRTVLSSLPSLFCLVTVHHCPALTTSLWVNRTCGRACNSTTLTTIEPLSTRNV